MTLRRAALLLATCALCAGAKAADPLDSNDCKVAREELEAALDEAPTRERRESPRLARARSRASASCLGPAKGNPARSGAPYPALAVPPIPVPGYSEPAAAAAAAPLVIPRPSTVTACDPAGCWDSEGRRLNQLGPMLVGPRGPCSLQAGMVSCP